MALMTDPDFALGRVVGLLAAQGRVDAAQAVLDVMVRFGLARSEERIAKLQALVDAGPPETVSPAAEDTDPDLTAT